MGVKSLSARVCSMLGLKMLSASLSVAVSTMIASHEEMSLVGFTAGLRIPRS